MVERFIRVIINSRLVYSAASIENSNGIFVFRYDFTELKYFRDIFETCIFLHRQGGLRGSSFNFRLLFSKSTMTRLRLACLLVAVAIAAQCAAAPAPVPDDRPEIIEIIAPADAAQVRTQVRSEENPRGRH